MRNGELETGDGKCQMANAECQMVNDEWQMADDECQVAEGELQMAEGELQIADEPCEVKTRGCDVKAPQKAPNEANLESIQSTNSHGVESEKAEPVGRERSQSAAGGQVVHDAGNDRVETIVAAGEGDGKARGRKGRSLPEAASATPVC
jgi:hypothetical protein